MNLAVRPLAAMTLRPKERREDSEFENTKISMIKAQNRLLTQVSDGCKVRGYIPMVCKDWQLALDSYTE